MTTTTQGIIDYYPSLLIIQYIGKARANAMMRALATPVVMPQTTVQTISFALAPTSGSFVVSWLGNPSAAINWNDSALTIQGKIQAIPGLSTATVTGGIAGLSLSVTFAGVTPPASLLVLVSSSLLATATPVIPTIDEVDDTLPLAIQNDFNLIGPDPAIGVQLDIIGKYVGVTRSGNGITGLPITLDDADFLSLIQMAIIQNNSGSSLAEIQRHIHGFFGNNVLVFDYTTMSMSYFISNTVGSFDMLQLFVTENLLPRPMTVLISVFYSPVINNFFGFRTYIAPAANSSPFNNYTTPQIYAWISYANLIFY
jgi:hypothetical protein